MPAYGNGPGDDRSVKDLVSELGTEAGTLIRKEVELARLEVKETASRVAQAGAMFSGAAVMGLMALGALSVAAGFGLATFMPGGVAALIVGVVYIAVAAALAAVGRGRLARLPRPQEAVEGVREDVQVAKEAFSRGASTEQAYGRPWATR